MIIEFNSIDQLDLVCSNSKNEVIVISQNEKNQSPTAILQEKNGVLFIKSFENPTVENMVEIDKLCAIQPIYTSFKISIPKNKNVQVIYAQGNFLTENFTGNLNLKLEEGIVKIEKYTGDITVTLYNGKVNCNAIEDTELKVNSNVGTIVTNFELDNGVQNTHEINGVFGQKISSLTIKSIMANIELTAYKN